jgi:hypothetical protein
MIGSQKQSNRLILIIDKSFELIFHANDKIIEWFFLVMGTTE